jgi:DNA-binding IclR family transcriptional regulator
MNRDRIRQVFQPGKPLACEEVYQKLKGEKLHRNTISRHLKDLVEAGILGHDGTRYRLAVAPS